MSKINDFTLRLKHEVGLTNIDASGVEKQVGSAVKGRVNIDSYETGGLSFQAFELGLKEVYGCQFGGAEASANLHIFTFVPAADRLTGVLFARVASTGAEVANAFDLGVLTFDAYGEEERSTENT